MTTWSIESGDGVTIADGFTDATHGDGFAAARKHAREIAASTRQTVYVVADDYDASIAVRARRS